MKLRDFVNSDKIKGYKIDDYEVNACFVQINAKGEVVTDNALMFWDGYYGGLKEYLLTKENSGIINALDEALEYDEEEFINHKGYVTNLKREIKLLEDGIKKGYEELLSIDSIYSYIEKDEWERILNDLIMLFKDADKNNNKVMYFEDSFAGCIDEDLNLQ